MNRPFPFIAALVVGLLFFQASSGMRADPPTWEQPHWKVGEDQHDEISFVDVATKTVSIPADRECPAIGKDFPRGRIPLGTCRKS